MHAKSAESFKAAIALESQNTNGAANRAYYAVYQAIVAELSKDHSAEDIDATIKDRKSDPFYDGPEWRHAFCRDGNTLTKYLSLDRRERQLVKEAWNLRVRADYFLENVRPEEIANVMEGLRKLLPTLGVTI